MAAFSKNGYETFIESLLNQGSSAENAISIMSEQMGSKKKAIDAVKKVMKNKKNITFKKSSSSGKTKTQKLMNKLSNDISSLSLSTSKKKNGDIESQKQYVEDLLQIGLPEQEIKDILLEHHNKNSVDLIMKSVSSDLNFDTIDPEFIEDFLSYHQDAFVNLSDKKRVIEKGADGNCLFYSLLQTLSPQDHAKVLGIDAFNYSEISSVRSKHRKHGNTLREYIGRKLLKAYKDKEAGKQSEEYNELRDIADNLVMASLAFNGNSFDDTMTLDKAFEEFNDTSFYAGDITIKAFSMLFKKNVIVMNMSSPDTEGTVIFYSYSEDAKFANNDPNYVILVRHGGAKSHFQTLFGEKLDEPTYLKDDVLVQINKREKSQLTYEEFDKLLKLSSKGTKKSKTMKNLKSPGLKKSVTKKKTDNSETIDVSKLKQYKSKKLMEVFDDSSKKWKDSILDRVNKYNKAMKKYNVIKELNEKEIGEFLDRILKSAETGLTNRITSAK